MDLQPKSEVVKTRVTFYTENRLVGGAERYLVELMNRLNPARHALSLVYAHNPVFENYIRTNLRVPAQVESISIRSLAASSAGRAVIRSAERGRPSLLAVSTYPRAIIRYLDFLLNRRHLERWFKHHPCEVLHINNGGYPGGHSCRAAILAATAAEVPVRLMAVHNVAYPYTPIVAVEKRLDQQVIRLTHQFITQSQAARTSLIQRRGFPADQITNIYFGVDRLPLPPPEVVTAKRHELGVPEGAPVVGMIALFEPRKGYQVLLQAAPAILNAVPDTRFVLVGNGPYFETIRAQAAPWGDRVIFTGHRDDFRDILATFKLLVLPSLEFESVPYVVLEAMAMGKPVVGSTDGGIPEAVANGETGLLAPPGNAQALAQAINTILLDPSLGGRFGQAGPARIQQLFDMDQMVARVDEMYQHYLGG